MLKRLSQDYFDYNHKECARSDILWVSTTHIHFMYLTNYYYIGVVDE